MSELGWLMSVVGAFLLGFYFGVNLRSPEEQLRKELHKN